MCTSTLVPRFPRNGTFGVGVKDLCRPRGVTKRPRRVPSSLRTHCVRHLISTVAVLQGSSRLPRGPGGLQSTGARACRTNRDGSRRYRIGRILEGERIKGVFRGRRCSTPVPPPPTTPHRSYTVRRRTSESTSSPPRPRPRSGGDVVESRLTPSPLIPPQSLRSSLDSDSKPLFLRLARGFELSLTFRCLNRTSK